MIQDIYPHEFNNQYIAKKNIEKENYVLIYNENSILIKTCDGELKLPRKKDFPEINDISDHTFLFTFNDIPCFLIFDKLNIDETYLSFKDISFFRNTNQHEIAWISILGYHLRNWYSENKYCGKCGARTKQKTDERALRCPECNSTIFPKISPAIIVAIICNNKILLARNSKFPGNWYSLIAGFVDVGETLEQTVIREVKEEVGINIKNIRYYKSQPWPLSGSIMIGFIAEADENQPINIDNIEITEAAWFSKENLPNHPSEISIAGEMIEKFKNGEL